MTNHRRLRLLLVALVPLVAACSKADAPESAYEDPSSFVDVEGTDLREVTFSQRAIERVGVETELVVDRSLEKIIPYSAVLYEADGSTWAYTEIKDRTFVRAPITVREITGDIAVLSDGPSAGTKIVTVGVAELFGVEHELGH